MKLFLNVQNEVLKGALIEIFEDLEGYQLAQDPKTVDVVLCDEESPHEKAFRLESGMPISLESLLRTLEKQQAQEIHSIARFSYNPRLRVLEDLEKYVSQTLTEKEAALLLYFWRHKGQEVGREALVKDIWGYHDDVDSHTLETHIYRLRQKIEEDPKSPKLLITTPGGYVFQA